MTIKESHTHSGATVFVDQHGYQAPAVYAGFPEEFNATTKAVGLHDASYIGRLKATGEDGLDLLNRMSTNKVDHLGAGEGAMTVLTTDRGRIVDVLGVVNQGDSVLLLTSPGQQQPVIDWLDKYTIMEDLVVEDVSSETAMLALVGPDAGKLLGLTPSAGPDSLSVQTLQLGEFSVVAVEQALGALPRYWLITSQKDAGGLWQHLAGMGAVPVGMQAMNAVRVECGVPEFGPELGEPYNPLEAGLIGSIDFAKGCYIGQEVIARLDSYKKVQKYLVSLDIKAEAQVSPGQELLLDGVKVGEITSLTQMHDGGAIKGLGYVKASAATQGAVLAIDGLKTASAEILGLPQAFGPAKD